MPILLESDMNIKIPKLYKVKQEFDGKKLDDINGHMLNESKKPEIRSSIKPGQKIAIAVGSRGIRNLKEIVVNVIEYLKEMGTEPFVVSAMGSHGGGTEVGQKQVLDSYGITEENLGVKVITKVDVIKLGQTSNGFSIFFDKTAYEADAVIPINRVKLHTDFVDEIQSGLCKMLVIGLGNHKGCTAIHEEDFNKFGKIIRESAAIIMDRVNIPFGVAIIENAYDQTAHIEFVPSSELISREIELVKIAKKNMPRLMIPKIDILIVEEIGKNISGAGYDPNILGKSYVLKEFGAEVPLIDKMILLDITNESHGNGIGMGIFDIITRNVFEKLNLEAMYANAIAPKILEDCKIPLIASNEDEAIKIAIKVLRGADKENLRIVKIKNTLELGEIQVSKALLPLIKENEKLSLIE